MVKEEEVITIVSPVPRNKLEDQLLEKSTILRVRTSPSLKGTVLGYLKANVYYNWSETKVADGYTWYKLADNQWVAKTSSMVVYPKMTEVEILREEVSELSKVNDDLNKQIALVNESVSELTKSNEELSTEISSLKTKNKELEDDKLSLESKVKLAEDRVNQAISILTGK